MPINIALFPILVFIPKFYTGEMGVPLALAANIILVVRIFDVITDPIFDSKPAGRPNNMKR